jgi:hypothetical protein
VPDGLDAYRAYRDRATAFLEARNQRIAAWDAGAEFSLVGDLAGVRER